MSETVSGIAKELKDEVEGLEEATSGLLSDKDVEEHPGKKIAFNPVGLPLVIVGVPSYFRWM